MNITLKTLQKYIAGIDAGSNGKNPVFYIHEDTRRETFAHDIVNMRHTGWYTNADGTTYKDGSGMARGIVVTLPPILNFPNGRFLAGYHWGDNDERVIYPELFDDEREAARRADSHAESFAEMQREDSERFDAMQTAESAADDAQETAEHAIEARNVSAWHRASARDSIRALRDARETLQRATKDYES